MALARYSSLADFFGSGLRNSYGTDRTISDNQGGVTENPYYGLDNNALFSKTLNGQSANDYWNNYVNSDAYKSAYGDPSKNADAPTLVNGMVKTQTHDDEFDPGTIIQAALMAAVGGLAAAGAGAGAGVASTGGAGAGGFAGSGLVDGLGAAAYGGAETGLGAGFGSGLVDGLGDAAAGYGGAADTIGGVGGSGLTQAEMDALINEAGSNITTGAAGGGVGTGAGGSATLGNQLTSLLNGGGTGSGLNTPPGASNLYKLLSGNGSGSDYLDAAGKLLPGLLSAGGNLFMANKQKQLADQYLGLGAPYRDQLANISANPQAFFDSPAAKQSLEAVLRRLSVGGNPAGDPYKQAMATGALFDRYSGERQLLGGLGGLNAFNAGAVGQSNAALGTQAQAISNVGSAISNVTNPQTIGTLETLLASLKKIGTVSGGLA